MKKKKNTTQKTSGNGFDELIRVHTDALMKNSQDIAEMLEIVQQKVGKSKRSKETRVPIPGTGRSPSLVREGPLEEGTVPTPLFLPGQPP